MATDYGTEWTALSDLTRRAISRLAGTRRLYHLDPDGVTGLHIYLDQFWHRALTGFKASVEKTDEEVS